MTCYLSVTHCVQAQDWVLENPDLKEGHRLWGCWSQEFQSSRRMVIKLPTDATRAYKAVNNLVMLS